MYVSLLSSPIPITITINIIITGNQYWGDQFLFQMKDMFSELCNHRLVPDCDFFINKRDYPHLKFNSSICGGIPVEPYGFIFDKGNKMMLMFMMMMLMMMVIVMLLEIMMIMMVIMIMTVIIMMIMI